MVVNDPNNSFVRYRITNMSRTHSYARECVFTRPPPNSAVTDTAVFYCRDQPLPPVVSTVTDALSRVVVYATFVAPSFFFLLSFSCARTKQNHPVSSVFFFGSYHGAVVRLFICDDENERVRPGTFRNRVVSRAPFSCQFVGIAYYIRRRELTRSDRQCRRVVYILPGRPRVIVIAVICDVRFRSRRHPFVNFFVLERHPIYNRTCWCLASASPNCRVLPV